MKVEKVPLNLIVEVDRAREDYGDIDELAENLREHGLNQPISVYGGGPEKQYTLIAGGRRLRAARKLGWEEIDAVVRYDEVTEIDRYELELIENVFRKDFTWAERCKLEKKIYEKKQAEDPNWSQNKTSSLLGRARSAISQDLELAEAMEVVPELAEADSQNEAWKKWNRIKEDFHVKQTVAKQKEEAKAVPKEEAPPTVRHEEGSKFIDYVESKYRIGDVFDGLKELSPIVDFMEVDPPYAVNLAEHRKKAQDQHIVSTYNELDEDTYAQWLEDLCTHLYNAMKDNAWGIFWYGSKWYPQVCWALSKAGFKFNATPAIWTKIGGGYSPQPNLHLANLYENFIVFRKGNPSLLKPGRANVFQYPQPTSAERIHPTQRPTGLIEEILRCFTTEASIICVPFLGSGATLRAAFELDRVAFGWDIDPIYKDRLVAKELEDAS